METGSRRRRGRDVDSPWRRGRGDAAAAATLRLGDIPWRHVARLRYASLLHKTWSRLAEKDARSTAKAVYVLHRLLSSPKCCGPDELLGFGAAYTELAKSRSKKTETHYFDRKVVARGASVPVREPTSPRTDFK